MRTPFQITLVALMVIGAAYGDDSLPDDLLRRLYDRADLIIAATVLEDSEGGMSTAPLPSDKPKVAILSTILRVQVDQVLKGEVATEKPLLVNALYPYSDKSTSIRFFRKGERHIFVLVRESGLRQNDEVVRYRTEDLWFGMLPVNEAMIVRFAEWGRPQ